MSKERLIVLPFWQISKTYDQPLGRLLLRIYSELQSLTWRAMLLYGIVHYGTSYLLLLYCGESELTVPDIFWYFYLTTATTVGYGDFSPVTSQGRIFTTLWVMPGGITLFTTLIAKAAQTFADGWRKRMRGMGNYAHLQGQVIVLGWAGTRTNRILELLKADETEARDVVLVCDLPENPEPELVHYVRSPVLSSVPDLERAGIRDASLIIVYTTDDNETLTATLTATALNKDAHVVVHFAEQSNADVVRLHCPQVETVVSVSVENTVRAAQDPGSSRIVTQMLSALDGSADAYRLEVPASFEPMAFGALMAAFKERYDATLLGLREPQEDVVLNPASTMLVKEGVELYLMAARRIRSDDVSWQELQALPVDGQVQSAAG